VAQKLIEIAIAVEPVRNGYTLIDGWIVVGSLISGVV
jgi:hypothetical protein